MSQTRTARQDVGVIAAIALLTSVGVMVMLASFILYISHKGGTFGLIPGFMGLVVSLWGAVKLVRVVTARPLRGTS